MEEATIVKKLLEHDEQFVQVRSEMGQFRNEINQRLDDMMVILQRLDQERIFTTEWIKRIGGETKRSRGDIDRMKQELKIDWE